MLANPRKQVKKNENRNDPVLGTLADELGICLQSFVENHDKTDSVEHLHNYFAVSPEAACKSLDRVLRLNECPYELLAQTVYLTHIGFMTGICIMRLGKALASIYCVKYREIYTLYSAVECYRHAEYHLPTRYLGNHHLPYRFVFFITVTHVFRGVSCCGFCNFRAEVLFTVRFIHIVNFTATGGICNIRNEVLPGHP